MLRPILYLGIKPEVWLIPCTKLHLRNNKVPFFLVLSCEVTFLISVDPTVHKQVDYIYSYANIDFYLKLLLSFPGATSNNMSPSNFVSLLSFPSDDPFSDPVLLNITFLDYGRPQFCSLPDDLLPDSLHSGSNLFWLYLPRCILQLFYFCLHLISIFHYQSSGHDKSSNFFLLLLEYLIKHTSAMSVVTNNSFAHPGFGASFYIVLTMKTNSISLYAVEFENFSFPFVKLLAEWREKHGTIIFPLFKINSEACLPTSTTKLEA